MNTILPIFIVTIHAICAAFQLATSLLHQRKVLYSEYSSFPVADTIISKRAFEFSRSIDLKAIDKYIIFLAVRFFTLCVGLLLFTGTRFPIHSHGILACFVFLSVIQGIYLVFTLPLLWKQSTKAVKSASTGNLIGAFVCLFVMKVMQKLLLILIFVPFYRFIMEFLILGTLFFFAFKVACASLTGWSVNDPRYENFDETWPIYPMLLDLCTKSKVSIDKIYYETSGKRNITVESEKHAMIVESNELQLENVEQQETDSGNSLDEAISPVHAKVEALTSSVVFHKLYSDENAEREQEMDLFSGELESGEQSSCSAYVYGFWGVKRLVLEKGIFSLLSDSEIIAICAHEIGHWQQDHNLSRFVFYYTQNFVVFGLFKLVYVFRIELGNIFVMPSKNLLFLMLILLPIIPIYYRLSDFCFNLMTRYQEFAADAFAVEKGYGVELMQALCKIYLKNKLSIDPHNIFSLFNVAQSHPPLIMRLKRIQSLMGKKV